MDQQMLVMLGLGGVAVVGIVFAVLPGLFTESRAAQRTKSIQGRPARGMVTDHARDPQARRKQVADSLKEIETRAGSKKVTLEAKLEQAGLAWSRRQFWLLSLVLGLVAGGLGYVLNGSLYITGALVCIGSFGLPNWIIAYLRKKRFKAFRRVFPEALDMITRGVKAGLPLGDCLRMIAVESSEPVKSEFKQVIQSQSIGVPLGDAMERMAERIPIPETNFFSIVINIQQKSGGNLSEALGNLSRVLRERKKMEGKIKAMSSEAKASAGIIGCLPFAVGSLVYVTSPQYISLLWTTSTGHMVMAGAAFWMSIGIFTIKKMVNFDF